jgi:beta-lactamase regulating signal transducer with metallopeptidase domain
MEQLFQHGLSNAAAAAALAILAVIATRIWRNPYFAYAAWLIVLVRLVAPPLLPVSVPLPACMMIPQPDASQDVPLLSGGRSVVFGQLPLGDETGKNAAEPRRFSSGTTIPDLSTHNGPIAPDVRGSKPKLSPGSSPRVPLLSGFRAGGLIPPDVRGGQLRGSGDPSGVDGGSRKNTAIPDASIHNVVNKLPTQPRESFIVNRLSLADLLATAWIAGTFCYLLLVGVRVVRFSRALRAGRRDVPEFLRCEAAAVAAMIGLRRSPRLAMIAAPLPPLVWPGWRPTVLLPQALIESLSVSQRRLLLLHEFVHIRRLDHRVRWFQLGVVALSWWNPIAWWAARRLERAEEDCCDAAVLRFHPAESQGYGQTLLAVAEFLSTGKLPAPALSIGIVRKNHLKRRLTMILNGPRWPRLSKTRFAIFCLAGAAMLAVTWRAVTAQNNSQAARAALERRIAQTSPKLSGAAPAQSVEQPDARLSALLKLEPLNPEPGDDELQKLLKERYNAAVRAVRLYEYQYEAGTARAGLLCGASRDLFEAELALVKSSHDKILVLERSADYCNKLWKQVHDKLIAGGVTGFSPIDEAEARAARFEAEIKLLRFRDELNSMSSERVSAFDSRPSTSPQMADRSSPLPRPIETPAARPEIVFLEKPASAGKSLPALLYPKRLEAAPGDDELRKLLKEKYNAAQRTMEVYTSRILAAGFFPPFSDFLAAGRNLRDAELALSEKPQSQLRILETYLEFTRYLENTADAKLLAGGAASETPLDAARMREARADAELKLLELKQLAGAPEVPKEPAARQPAVSPHADAAGTASSATSVRPDGAESFPGPAPDIRDASGPLNPGGKSLADLVKFENQKPQPGESPQRKQLMERYNDALRSVKSKVNRFEQGKTSAKLLCDAAREFTDARLALFKDLLDRVPIANWYAVFTLRTWKETEEKLHAGGNTRENRDDEAAAREALSDARSKYDAVIAALPALMSTKVVEISPNDDERQKLLIEQFNAASRHFRAAYNRCRMGSTPFAGVIAAARELCTADVARSRSGDVVAAHDRGLELLRYLENLAESIRKNGGPIGPDAVEAAHAARLEAELELLDAKRAAGNQKPSSGVKAVAPAASSQPVARGTGSKELPALLTAEPLQPGAGDNERTKLLKQRFNAALGSLQWSYKRREVDPSANLRSVLEAGRQILAAELALEKPQDILGVSERYLELMKFLEQKYEAEFKAGGYTSRDELDAAHEARLDAEIKLLDARQSTAAQKRHAVQTAVDSRRSTEENPASSGTRPILTPALSPNSATLPAWLTAEPLKVAPGDDDRKKLLKERYNAALQSLKAVDQGRRIDPTVTANDELAAARQLLAADVALHKSGDVVAAYEHSLGFLKYLENIVRPAGNAGTVSPATYEAVHEARLDAEVKLLDVTGGTTPFPDFP